MHLLGVIEGQGYSKLLSFALLKVNVKSIVIININMSENISPYFMQTKN